MSNPNIPNILRELGPSNTLIAFADKHDTTDSTVILVKPDNTEQSTVKYVIYEVVDNEPLSRIWLTSGNTWSSAIKAFENLTNVAK